MYSGVNNYGVWEEMPNELYVIGDIHGDFFALKQSLELTECIIFDPYIDNFNFHKNGYYYLNDGCEYYSVEKGNIKWNNEKKNCFIVFSGDIIDRCRPNIITNRNCINTVSDENCDLLLLKLLYDLDIQARLYNSKVIIVLGNHEIMNIKNELKYVSLKGIADNRIIEMKNLLINNLEYVYGIVRINKYIIVHGGINDNFFNNFNNYNSFELIQTFNYELRKLLKNNITKLSSNNLFNNESPFWDRTLGGRSYLNTNQCKQIFENNILKINNFDSVKKELKIIVAHCPQFSVNQNINLVNCQEYENRIWRIDVGMSRAFDLYDMDKIEKKLSQNTNILNILKMNYNDFFITDNQTSFRNVSCIKLTKINEEIKQGKLTIDYFYSQEIFKSNKMILLHILSDLIKIFIDNYNQNYNPTQQIFYLKHIDILKNILFLLNNLSK